MCRPAHKRPVDRTALHVPTPLINRGLVEPRTILGGSIALGLVGSATAAAIGIRAALTGTAITSPVTAALPALLIGLTLLAAAIEGAQ